MSQDIVDSMGKTLGDLSSVLGNDLIDFEPTITPVLDLTQVKKEAGSLVDILAMPAFDLGSTSSSAQNANNGFEDNRDASDGEETTNGSGSTVIFKQTNNSPKALSQVEIYRQTKNLISQTKKEGS